jgi:hypothetical protein
VESIKSGSVEKDNEFQNRKQERMQGIFSFFVIFMVEFIGLIDLICRARNQTAVYPVILDEIRDQKPSSMIAPGSCAPVDIGLGVVFQGH